MGERLFLFVYCMIFRLIMITKIISGGQAGADRVGLDAAIHYGLAAWIL